MSIDMSTFLSNSDESFLRESSINHLPVHLLMTKI